MSNLETKRHIDTLKDEISCAIAHSELIRAWKKWNDLVDVIAPFDDVELENFREYWQAAVDESFAWLINANEIETQIEEYLHFEQTPHVPQGLHHENIGDALAAFPIYPANGTVEDIAPEEPYIPVVDYGDFWL